MLRAIFAIGLAGLLLQLASAAFQDDCLAKHNQYRAMHGVPPLTLDSAVQAWAQDWANHLASTGTFQHRPNNKYGENLYAAFGASSVTGDVPVKAWYDEIKDYDFNNPGFGMNTGHFTQVVWKNSKKLGCAVAKQGTSTYVVANYDPPGNYQGQFPQNVPPPL